MVDKVSYTREWRHRNPERVKEYYKRRYQKHAKEILASNKKWTDAHKISNLGYQKQWSKDKYLNTRMSLIESLGGKCAKCDINDFRILCIDHKNGGGHREIKSMQTFKYMEHISQNLQNYQLLCHNCNWLKRWERQEVRKSKYNL